MKRSIILTSALIATVLSGTALADDMGGMKMDNMDGMSMPKKTTAHGVGVVKAIDSKAGTVTLAHQPIPALHWPAMTMAFKVAKPELLNGLATGGKVKFELQGEGMNQTVTAIGSAN